jgi:hypothetical protein
MDSEIPEKEIMAVVGRKDGRGVLTCEDALFIAEKLGVKPETVGEFCNMRKIKIISCKLGCFK